MAGDNNLDETAELETGTEVSAEKPKNNDKYDAMAAHVRRTKEYLSQEISSLKNNLEELRTSGVSVPVEDENDLKAQLKQTKKELDKLTRTLAEEKKAAQAEKERNAIFATLNDIGVMNSKILYNHLRAEDMIGRNEEGDLVFRTGGKNGVESELLEGLKEWLGTAEGKMFLPPSGASGSGAVTRSGTTASRSTGLTKEDKKAQAEAALAAWAKSMMRE